MHVMSLIYLDTLSDNIVFDQWLLLVTCVTVGSSISTPVPLHNWITISEYSDKALEEPLHHVATVIACTCRVLWG